MRAHLPRFLITAAAVQGETVALPADEAKHVRVRRLGVGDLVALFDGGGRSYTGHIESLSRERAVVRVVEILPERDGESPLALTLAVAVLKSDRFDWLIEKTTELGVSGIQPFTSTHTLARPSRARQARWRHIALGAAKQCGRSLAPAVAAPLDFSAVLALPVAARICCAEDGSGVSLARLTLAAPPSLLVIVGAEGGFSPDELSAARAAGCHMAALGPRVLRAETAALAAVSLCQAYWGDLAPG